MRRNGRYQPGVTLVDRATFKREANKMWALAGDDEHLMAVALHLDELARMGEKVLCPTDRHGRVNLEVAGRVHVFDLRNLTLDSKHVPQGYVGEVVR